MSRDSTDIRAKLRAEASDRLRLPAKDASSPSPDLLHELQVHQIELEMQNEELQRAQVAIEEARDRLADLYHLAPVGYFTLSDAGQILDANMTGAGLLGVDRKALVGRPFASFVAPVDGDRWRLFLSTLVTRGEWLSFRLSMRRRDGSVLHVHLACDSRPGVTGTSIRVVATDISEQVQTERTYQTYVDAAPHALLVVDARGRYVDCNPAGLELLGVDATTLKTLSIADFLDESNRREALHEFTVLLATGKIENDYLIVRPDGRKVWVALRAVKLTDDRYLAFCLDVTERKKAEKALRDCERRFRALGNGAPVGTFQTGPGGEPVSVNAEWKRMTGLGEADPAGSAAWEEILHPADRERVSREWKDALDRGRPFAAEFRIQPRGGKVTWIFGCGTSLRDHAGGPIGYVTLLVEISERRVR
jgi:PAS domain S-box-containing protein